MTQYRKTGLRTHLLRMVRQGRIRNQTGLWVNVRGEDLPRGWSQSLANLYAQDLIEFWGDASVRRVKLTPEGSQLLRRWLS